MRVKSLRVKTNIADEITSSNICLLKVDACFNVNVIVEFMTILVSPNNSPLKFFERYLEKFDKVQKGAYKLTVMCTHMKCIW